MRPQINLRARTGGLATAGTPFTLAPGETVDIPASEIETTVDDIQAITHPGGLTGWLAAKHHAHLRRQLARIDRLVRERDAAHRRTVRILESQYRRALADKIQAEAFIEASGFGHLYGGYRP